MNTYDEQFFWDKYSEYRDFLITQVKCNRDKEKYKSVYKLFKSLVFTREPSLYYYLLTIDELEFFIQDSYSYSLWNNDKKIMLKACEHIRDLIHSFQIRYKI